MPEIPKQMKAVQVVEFNKPYQINTVDVPSPPTPNDILVKVAVAGYCHTEQLVAEGVFKSKLPITASHEGSGTIVSVGSSVKDFAPGDRVMVGIMTHACGKCRSCQLGKDMKHYCQHSDAMTGVTRDGCFAEYVWADASECQKIPDGVTFETAAPMACAGRTAYRAVAQAKLKPGQTIGIVGAGGALGHLGIQFAKKVWELKVVGVDARDPGLDLARKTGADLVVDAREDQEKLVKQVMDFTGESEGCDATVNFSDAGSAAATACAITKMHARMIQVAQPENVSVPFAELIFRDIRIEGSLLCPAGQSQEMLNDVAKHGISVATNPSHGLDNVKEAADRAHGGKMSGKAIVIVDQEQIKEEKEKYGANI